MSEQPNTESVEDVEETNENFVQLRDAYKELKREAKELRAFRESAEPKLRASALRDAGFDPESPQAKGLLKLHEGDLDAEALKETAAAYGLAPSGEGEGSEAPKPELSSEQQQAIASADRGQQLTATASPVEPQTLDERIRAAEAKAAESGDWSEWDQLQAQASLARHG